MAVDVIDIADINAPVLSPLQRQVLDAAEAAPVTLTETAVLDAARAQTGLHDFGPDDFRERLGVWIEAINEDEDASAVTRANLFQLCVRYAATRLRVEDLVRRHPEILDIVIDRPIVVAGLPRSGTTHLLGLISADRRLRSLPWWEAIAPVPTEADAPSEADLNPRRTRADLGWQGYDALLPYMKALHEFSADHISEDIELQAVDFSSYLLEWLAYVPRWRDHYLSHDQGGTYAYLKKMLQVLTWFRGPNRWVIKCPQHMEQLPALRATFPDATFVITHRDPVASIQSAATMSAYAARVFRRRLDGRKQADYWVDRYVTLLQACARDRDILPAAQTLDVYFHEWIADPDVILRQIYKLADLPLTDETLGELHAYLDAHPAGRQGKVVHNMRRDFGLDPAVVRERFAFYFDRFPVQVEVK